MKVEFDLLTTPSDTYVEITLGEEALFDAYDDAIEGYCVVCRNNTVAGDCSLCCDCLEIEMKIHNKVHDCVKEAVERLGICDES